MFRQLKNNIGMSISNLYLGYYNQINNFYLEAIEYYERARIYVLQDLGCFSLSEFKKKFI